MLEYRLVSNKSQKSQSSNRISKFTDSKSLNLKIEKRYRKEPNSGRAILKERAGCSSPLCANLQDSPSFKLKIWSRCKSTNRLITFHQTPYININDSTCIEHESRAFHYLYMRPISMCVFDSYLELCPVYRQLANNPIFIRYYNEDMINVPDDGEDPEDCFGNNCEIWITMDNDLNLNISFMCIESKTYKITIPYSFEGYSGEFMQFNKLKELAVDEKQSILRQYIYEFVYPTAKYFYLKEFGEVIGNTLPTFTAPIRVILLDYITG